jgi:ParB/RepB/Spo0J family partition protein
MKMAENARAVVNVPLDRIRPDEGQARKEFDDAQIEELAASVQQVGVLEPIELRGDETRPGHYVIVYGERRWRAARLAGLATIPAFVDRDAGGVRRRQLYENVMRVDLNVVELAANVAAVMVEDALDTSALAEQLRWPLRKVQRLVEIHDAPDPVKRAIVSGIEVQGGRRVLSLSHALDVVRAYRHYAREDDTDSKGRASARLDRLVARVLGEDWSARKLQEYVGVLGRSPKRDPLDRAAKAVATRTASVEDTVPASAPSPRPTIDSGSRRYTPTKPRLFEAKRDRFTVFVTRAKESEDATARAELRDTLLAMARELAP